MIRPALAGTALLLAASAHAASIEDPSEWKRIRFGDAIVLTDAKPEAALDLARQLVVARALLDDLLPELPDGSTRPDVYVAGKTADALHGLIAGSGATPSWVGGALLPGAGPRSEVYFVTMATPAEFPTAARTLRGYKPAYGIHVGVYVRQVLRGSWRDAPFWLTEGLSSYFTNFDVRDGGVHLGGVPIHLRPALEFGEVRVDLDVMFAFPKVRTPTRATAGRVQSQGWAIIDALMHVEPDGRAKLRRLVRALREGRDPREAWTASVGTDPESFRDRALARLGAGGIPGGRYPLGSFDLPEPGPVEPAPPAEVLGILAKAWLRKDPKEIERAERRANAALAAAPEDARGLWALAEVRRRQGRVEQARDLARRSRASTGDRKDLAIEAETLEALLGAVAQP